MIRVSVIGAGSWGTALAILLARSGHKVSLWSRNKSVVAGINASHVNPVYLSFASIPLSVIATDSFQQALDAAELVILAAPSQAFRELLISMKDFLPDVAIIVSASKGLEKGSGKRISEVVSEVIGERRFVCVSGPSFAKEVVIGHPTAVVAASDNLETARIVQETLSFENLRVYTNADVVGTELGGATKNVMAIAAGMVSGLGLGANTLAALITRGLAEMSRLAMHEGAQRETLMGLAGIGDLVLTCTGELSRNRHVGVRLGQGHSPAAIAAEMKEVAEGVETTLAVKLLADKAKLEMPITDQVKAVLYEGKAAGVAVAELMGRPLKQEC